jgi:cell division septal protein FtsQ
VTGLKLRAFAWQNEEGSGANVQRAAGEGVIRRGRLRLLLIAVPAVLICLSVAGWFSVRNSTLVAVEQVKVVGLAGHYDKNARDAVVAEARSMTTMNFDSQKVREAASQFVDVAGVEVQTHFPHGATIRLAVRRPVLVARVAGRTVTLSQSGEVMTPARSVAGLPRIDSAGTISDGRVSGGHALEAARLLGAAPDVLLRKVATVDWGRLGIVVTLTNGPRLYFGDASSAARKWKDAATVLAAPASRGAAYLDLRVPGRVALGGLGGAPPPAASGATVEGASAVPTEQAPVQSSEPSSSQQTAGEAAPTPAPAPAPTQPPGSVGGAAPGT